MGHRAEAGTRPIAAAGDGMTERITEGSRVLEHVGDPGIVVFGKSMHVTYVNDRARQFFDCAKGTSTSVPPQDDLMFQIVKSVAGIRDRLYSEPETGSRADASDEITISTASGPFRILAFPVPQMSVETNARVMVIIHKCRSRRKIPGSLETQRPERLTAGD